MSAMRQTQLGPVGKSGEDAAVQFLEKNGFRILERNRKFGRLEIDIICAYAQYIVFVEVKTRTERRYAGNSRFPTAAQAVTYEKQKRLISAARQYIREERPGKYPRFDVIEVYLEDGSAADSPHICRLNHIVNAFGA